MNLDRTSLAVYGSNIGISLVGFVGTAYFAQTLGASALGIFFTFDAVTSVISVFTRFGLDTGIEKRMSEAGIENRGAYLSAGYLISAVPIVLISILLFLFDGYLNEYIGAPIVPIIVALLVASTGRYFLTAALRAEGSVALNSGIELGGEVVRVLFTIWLIFLDFGVYALFYGVLIGIGVKIILIALFLQASLSLPNKSILTDLWDFSKYTLLTSVSTLAYNWMDTLVLAYFLSKANVGIYEASWKVSVVAVMASQALATVVFPAISNWESKGERAKIENAITESFTYGLFLVIPAVVGAMLLAEPFMKIVYAFETGSIILVLLMAEKLFQAPRLIVEKTLTAIDKPNLVFRASAVTLVANLGLNILLIPVYGMYGAASATLSTVFLALTIEFWYLRRFLTISIPVRNLSWQVGASLVMGAVVFAFIQFFPPTSIFPFAGLVLLGIVVYGAAALSNREMRARVFSLLPVS